MYLDINLYVNTHIPTLQGSPHTMRKGGGDFQFVRSAILEETECCAFKLKFHPLVLVWG